MLLMLLVFQAAVTQAASPLWNMSIGAWAGFLLSIIGIVGGLIAVGRFIQTLNGFGERLKSVEGAQNESEGHRNAMQTQINRILDQHQSILERLGEAKRSTEKCSEETVDLGIQIGARIDTLGREVNAMNLNLSQRLKAVETVLKLKEP